MKSLIFRTKENKTVFLCVKHSSRIISVILIFILISCKKSDMNNQCRIVFLHHSTGQNIWDGNRSNSFSRVLSKYSSRIASKFNSKAELPDYLERYNKENQTQYLIEELTFPKLKPYGWNNYPFDYYNIWVKNAGEQEYKNEPTLEILTREYDVIIFKHCFPVCNIQPDRDVADINSEYKSIANYKLQYQALKEKLLQFPNAKFILFTGAAQVNTLITEEEAIRAKDFFTWVISEWDQPGDNIYIWDLYNIQTQGELYFQEKNAFSANNSHIKESFAAQLAILLFNRIIDVIKTDGSETNLSGKPKFLK